MDFLQSQLRYINSQTEESAPIDKSRIVKDILLQAGLILFVVIAFLTINNIPQKLFAKLRYRFRNKTAARAKRHFVLGAQLLAQSRSADSLSSSASASASASQQALDEAEKAIALVPKDAAAHILKSLALDAQGYKTSALDAIDVALSPLCRKSLTDEERGDALVKRAEIMLSMNRKAQVDPVIEDLNRAVELSPENVKAFCTLGECYEGKKMTEEARKAYEAALRVQPRLKAAMDALERLGSS
ncbi:hypothetical protein D8674_033545 [Pyrus ussuriensis x Pyrus communis]|uniref:Uncharacterized protein n=1 Tax=Pyrus ussuriensis x Pyrus communis TaxID=2448454 RepID=A0A5N5GN20_9ROSA|nr:hypothetical protein D8674_012855 [Pyrus ussuriensis x Pyrus communis]KAB2628750.1 hypothetical protein D8674_033545 [Pyrus ussuriensis x Pyrus communis]